MPASTEERQKDLIVKGFIEALERMIADVREHGDAGWLGSDGMDPEAIGQAAALAIPRPTIWSEQLGPLLTSSEIRDLLGRISREALAQRVSRGTFLALRDARGKVRYPLFQIDESTRAPYPEIRDLIHIFRDRELSSWELASYMTTPQPPLEGLSPAAWMAERRPAEPLLGAGAEAAAALSH